MPLWPPVVDPTPLPDPPPAFVAPAVAWGPQEGLDHEPGWLAVAYQGRETTLVPVRRVDLDTTGCIPDEECGGGCPYADYAEVPPDPGTFLVLVRRPDLRPGPVAATTAYQALSPGAEVHLVSGAATADLVVRGASTTEIYDSCTHQGEVVLRHRAPEGRVTDTVVWTGCSDDWPVLRWAGDLDGDGVPELLIETGEGSGYTFTLWWSDPSRPGAVRVVGELEVSDC